MYVPAQLKVTGDPTSDPQSGADLLQRHAGRVGAVGGGGERHVAHLSRVGHADHLAVEEAAGPKLVVE